MNCCSKHAFVSPKIKLCPAWCPPIWYLWVWHKVVTKCHRKEFHTGKGLSRAETKMNVLQWWLFCAGFKQTLHETNCSHDWHWNLLCLCLIQCWHHHHYHYFGQQMQYFHWVRHGNSCDFPQGHSAEWNGFVLQKDVSNMTAWDEGQQIWLYFVACMFCNCWNFI